MSTPTAPTPDEWPCANFQFPFTCLTAPTTETGRCDHCRQLRHNHDADGVYDGCPACGTATSDAADEREALVEAAAEALFCWNGPTDPYFVIHGRSGDVSAEDPYLPIARAVLDAVVDRLVAPLKARLAEVEAERDEWQHRRDAAVELCRFRHQDGLTAEEWHVRICAAAEGAQRERLRAERAEADLAAAEQRALYAARDALYRGEGPDMFQDADIVYGEWLGNRADRLATQAANVEEGDRG